MLYVQLDPATGSTTYHGEKENRMTYLEQALQAVEYGLLPAVSIEGRPQPPLGLRERMARFRVPGFGVALIEGSEIAAVRGYGVKDVGAADPVTGDTLFQAASISKAVTAMAALHLVEAGILDLDIDVNQALRSWQVPDNEHTQTSKVTLRRLLSHTAGLTVYGYRGYPIGEDLPTLQKVLDGEPPANSDPVRVFQEPGTAYSYSSGSDMVVQQLLIDVTGEPFPDLLQNLIFDKLGMAHSTFEQPLPEVCAAAAATAHRSDGQPVPGRWHVYPEQAAAGLWTTPSDLARLVVEMLKSFAGQSNAVLSAEMTRQMLTRRMGPYGLGFFIIELEGRTRFQRPGWNEGYHSYIGGCVDDGRGIVWMTNGENGMLLGLEVLRGLSRLLDWPDFHSLEKAVAQVAPAVLEDYAGSYRYPDYPEFGAVVGSEGDHLVLRETPDGLRYELYPESDTTFFALDRHEPFAFIRDDDGRVETMMIGAFERLNRTE
jgi:CubicO group peptidase (beta-lactamase class C family)